MVEIIPIVGTRLLAASSSVPERTHSHDYPTVGIRTLAIHHPRDGGGIVYLRSSAGLRATC